MEAGEQSGDTTGKKTEQVWKAGLKCQTSSIMATQTSRRNEWHYDKWWQWHTKESIDISCSIDIQAEYFAISLFLFSCAWKSTKDGTHWKITCSVTQFETVISEISCCTVHCWLERKPADSWASIAHDWKPLGLRSLCLLFIFNHEADISVKSFMHWLANPT